VPAIRALSDAILPLALALCGGAVPFVRLSFAIIGGHFTIVGDPIPFVGDTISFVGDVLSPGHFGLTPSERTFTRVPIADHGTIKRLGGSTARARSNCWKPVHESRLGPHSQRA
jgi:hypothetical protein